MKTAMKRMIVCMLVFLVAFTVMDTEALAAKKSSYTSNDLRLLSSIVYCESGNQSYKGQVAVANVVLNRVKSRKFPNSIKGVVYQRGQFTPARSGSLSKALKLYDKKSSKLRKATKAAKAALSGEKAVKNSTLYFSGYSSKKVIKRRYSSAFFIGAHYFR